MSDKQQLLKGDYHVFTTVCEEGNVAKGDPLGFVRVRDIRGYADIGASPPQPDVPGTVGTTEYWAITETLVPGSSRAIWFEKLPSLTWITLQDYYDFISDVEQNGVDSFTRYIEAVCIDRNIEDLTPNGR